MAEESIEIAETPQDEDHVIGAAEEMEPQPEVEAEAQPVETEPLAGEAEPPVEEAEPPVEEAEPPVEEAEPPVEEAEPPVEEAEPPVEEAEPPVEEAEPPVEEAELPVGEAEPPTDEAEPPVEEAEPPVEEAEPPVNLEHPPVEADDPAEEVEPPTDEAELPTEEAEGHGHKGHEHPADSTELPTVYADVLIGSAIPPENHAEVHDAFCLVSKGRSYIEGRDVRQLILALGQDYNCDDTVQQLLEEQGLDHDSHLGFAETVTLISNAYRPRSQLTDLMSSFRVFDRNGNGYLEYDELYRAMFEIGSQALEDSAKEDFDHLVRLVDKNKDGRIDYSEFCQIVTMSVSELRGRLNDG